MTPKMIVRSTLESEGRLEEFQARIRELRKFKHKHKIPYTRTANFWEAALEFLPDDEVVREAANAGDDS